MVRLLQYKGQEAGGARPKTNRENEEMKINANPKGPKFQAFSTNGETLDIHFMDDETFEAVVTGSGSGFQAHVIPGPVSVMPSMVHLESNGILSIHQASPEITRVYGVICESTCEDGKPAPEAVDTLLAWTTRILNRFPYV